MGIGQILHQERPPKGMKNNLSALHQAIHTKIIAKLWLPTTGPNKPAKIVKTNPARVMARIRN
jgi:hypothetical protein